MGLQLIIIDHSWLTITSVITTHYQKSLLEPKIPPFHDWSTESLSLSLSTAPQCTGCRQDCQKQCCSLQCFSKIRFHGILRKLLCFACPENIARRSQGCYVQTPFNSRDHMRQQHFPLIMNQFSANRPMWGISIYVWRSLGLIEVPHLQRTLN